MTITAKRMYGPDNPGTSAADLFTVTSSHRYVIREVYISNVTGLPATITMSIGADATDTRVLDAVVVPGHSVLPLKVYWVLESTEKIQAFQGTASALNVMISGLDEV